MSFLPVFATFWEKVIETIENRTFAKLTLAKTIGDTDLKNIYVRPVLRDNGMYLSIIKRFKTEEIESFHALEDTYNELLPYLTKPFLTAILFSTENDLIFKLNKKRAGSITEQAPTFKDASDVMLEMKRENL